jgi:hypothetical protein
MPLGTHVDYTEIEQFARCPRRWAWGSVNGRNLGFYKQPTNVNLALRSALRAYAAEAATNAESALASAKLVLRAEMDSLPQDKAWDKSLAAGLGVLDHFHSRYPTLGFELRPGGSFETDLFPGTETILNSAYDATIIHDDKLWLVRFIVSQRPVHLHSWRWDTFDEDANLLFWNANQIHNYFEGICYIHVKVAKQLTVRFHTPNQECINDSYIRAKSAAQAMWVGKDMDVIAKPYDRQFWCSHCPFVDACTAKSCGQDYEATLMAAVGRLNQVPLVNTIAFGSWE